MPIKRHRRKRRRASHRPLSRFIVGAAAIDPGFIFSSPWGVIDPGGSEDDPEVHGIQTEDGIDITTEAGEILLPE